MEKEYKNGGNRISRISAILASVVVLTGLMGMVSAGTVVEQSATVTQSVCALSTNQTSLNFGSILGGSTTPIQKLLITSTGNIGESVMLNSTSFYGPGYHNQNESWAIGSNPMALDTYGSSWLATTLGTGASAVLNLQVMFPVAALGGVYQSELTVSAAC